MTNTSKEECKLKEEHCQSQGVWSRIWGGEGIIEVIGWNRTRYKTGFWWSWLRGHRKRRKSEGCDPAHVFKLTRYLPTYLGIGRSVMVCKLSDALTCQLLLQALLAGIKTCRGVRPPATKWISWLWGGEAPVLELWGLQITPSLPEMVVLVGIPSVGKIYICWKLFVWNKNTWNHITVSKQSVIINLKY